jgi:hypothetical protein
VAVGADDAADDVADRHAIAHLGQGGVVVLPEDFERRVLESARFAGIAAMAFGRSLGLAGRCSRRAASRWAHQKWNRA